MDGVYTDPRLLAIEKAVEGMDPQKAQQYLLQHADSGLIPGSLNYLMQLYNKAKAIEKSMPQQQQQQAMQQPTIKDKLQQQVMSAQQMPPQPAMPPQGQPPGLAGMPTNLARPQTFNAAGGGIVAFGVGGKTGDDPEDEEIDVENYDVTAGLPAAAASPQDDLLKNLASGKMKLSEMRRAKLDRALNPAPRVSSEATEKNRQELEKNLGLAGLRKKQKAMYDDALNEIAAQRADAKALFFLQAGRDILNARGAGTLGNIMQGFAAPAGEYLKTKKELGKEERLTKRDLLDMREKMVQQKLGEFDRLVSARGLDAATEEQRRTAAANAASEYATGEENIQLTRERFAAANRSRANLGRDIWGDDLKTAAATLREAERSRDPQKIAAAQSAYDKIEARVNKLSPAGIQSEARIDAALISKVTQALTEARKPGGNLYNLNLKVQRAKTADEKKTAQAALKDAETAIIESIKNSYLDSSTGAGTRGGDDWSDL